MGGWILGAGEKGSSHVLDDGIFEVEAPGVDRGS